MEKKKGGGGWGCGGVGVSSVPSAGWEERKGSLVFCFLSLTGAATSIMFVATNTCLSLQKYACRDKSFVATNIFLSRQACFCRDKHVFVATKVLCVFGLLPLIISIIKDIIMKLFIKLFIR